MRKILKAFSFFLFITSMFGCKNDGELPPVPQPNLNYTINTTKGSPVLIYCRTFFNSEYEKEVNNFPEIEDHPKFRLVTNPLFGSVRVVDDGLFGDHWYFYYEPNQLSQVEEDRFVVEMVSHKGKRVAAATLHIASVKGCEKGPLITYVKIQKNSHYSLDLLDNDLFCTLDLEDVAINPVRSINSIGTLDYTDDLNPSLIFTYTPNPDFTGVSEFYYTLGVNPNQKKIVWGINMQASWYYHPEVFEKFVSVKLVVEVVE